MKRSILIAAALWAAAAIPSRAIGLNPSLSQTYGAALTTMQTVVKALEQGVANRVEKLQVSAPASRIFSLICTGRFWLISPTPNPPGSGLLIAVDKGDHVEIKVSNFPSEGSRVISFDLDGMDLLIDGTPSKGAHLRLQPRTEVFLEFDATTPGVHPISNPEGKIIIR